MPKLVATLVDEFSARYPDKRKDWQLGWIVRGCEIKHNDSKRQWEAYDPKQEDENSP